MMLLRLNSPSYCELWWMTVVWVLWSHRCSLVLSHDSVLSLISLFNHCTTLKLPFVQCDVTLLGPSLAQSNIYILSISVSVGLYLSSFLPAQEVTGANICANGIKMFDTELSQQDLVMR